jgi:hypothetical protein
LMAGISLGTNTISAAVMPAMKNVSKVLPGVIGIALGRNPDGATKDIGHNYKSLENRWELIAIAGAGGVGLWALCNFGAISRWSFAVGIAVWTLAVVTNLVALAQSATPRRPFAIAALAAGLAVAIIPDWNDIATPGWRVLLGFGLCVVSGQLARRLMDATPRVTAESPDAIGLDRPFTPEEIERADRMLGVPA